MLRWLVEASLRYRFLVLASAVALMGIGFMRARSVPIDVFPEFASTVVEVQTDATGLSAGEVERLVTLPVEEILSGVSWLKTMHSESVAGLSSVRMIFEPGIELARARQLVQERLTLSYSLPTVAKSPIMMQPMSATSRVVMIALSSKDLSLVEQSVIAQWTIKPKLLGVPGVSNVAIWGERKRQLQVQVDPELLRKHGVKQEQVVSSTGDALYVASLSFLKASNPGSGGWIDGPNQRLEIRHVLPISSAEDLGKVAVNGTKLRLSEIAKVVEGAPPMVGDAIVNGQSGIMLVVEKLPGASSLDVARRVEAALTTMRQGMPGLTIDSQVFRSAGFIEQAIENHAIAFALGLALLALVLAVALQSWRAALVSILSIVLALSAACVALVLTGATINTVVVAGLVLALAVVVDELVGITGSILRRSGASAAVPARRTVAGMIADSVVSSRRAIGYTTLILLLVILPVLYMGGLTGAFLRPLAYAYGLGVVTAMLVAVAVTPSLAMLLLGKPSDAPKLTGFGRWLQNRYDGALAGLLHQPAGAYAIAALAALCVLGAWPLLSRSLLPDYRERTLVMRWDAKPGTSHPEMVRITSQVIRDLKGVPGVQNVAAHIGRALSGDQIVNMNSGQIWLSMDASANYDATVEAVRSVIDEYPGVDRNIQSYLGERVRDALTGSSSPVVVRLFGPDRDTLKAKAEEVRTLLSRINGITDLKVEGTVEEPQLHVKVDLVAASKVGLKPGDVRRAAATMSSGLEVGKIFEQQKVFDVIVWSKPETRSNMSGLQNIMISTPSGEFIRLGDVSEIRVVPTPAVIRHERSSPYIDVTANVLGRGVGDVLGDVEKRLADIQFPLEHHPEILGEYAERRLAQTRMWLVALVSAIGILLLLQSLLGNWRMSGLTIAAALTSLAGGVVVAMATGGLVSLGSLLGFLAIAAIAIRQTVAMLQHYHELQAERGAVHGLDLVQRGASERMIPTLAAALAVASICLPFILMGNVAGFEIERPMAITILSGLVTSTFMVLFIIPALYLRYGAMRNQETFNGVFEHAAH